MPRTGHAPKSTEPVMELATKKVSRHGVTIAPPSASSAHKLHPTSAGAKAPAEAHKPEAPAEPQLAALPITPMEQPSGPEAKVEGKEELLAAMPIEIRRTIASASGQQASEWNVPDFSAAAPAPAAPAPAAETLAPASPAETPAATPANETPAAPPAAASAPAPAPAPETPAPQEQATAAPEAVAKGASTPTAPMSSSQAAAAAASKSKRSEAAVFIIMFVLFVLLGTLVVLLFLSGSIAL